MFPDWLHSDRWSDRERQPGPGQPGGHSPDDPKDETIRPPVDDLIDQFASGTADEWLAGRAAEALSMDPLVRGPYLEIFVQNRVVILQGEAGSAEARHAAGRRAWSVPGVRDVCNRLIVAGPYPRSS